jgi:predicted ATPase/DNA-binding SARP family transcriptional activator
VEFELLGPLRVVEGGRDVTPARPKQRALLAMLLLHREEVVSGAQLIEALWGEEPPETAPTALHGHVSKLRKLIGTDRIRTRPPGYLLQVSAGELDVSRFESLIAQARERDDPDERSVRIREALALWHGEPLAELRYEAFAEHEIARLKELRVAAIEDRVDADLALGRHVALVPELETVVAENPFRERLRGQLMLALYRSGRQAEALHVFQNGRRALGEELGIDPGPALQQLELRILRQDSSLSLPAERVRDELAEIHDAPAEEVSLLGSVDRLSGLPGEASSFVGREHELAELRSLLGGTRLLTLAGTGGAGKTRLALELARGAEAFFADGAALVELAAVADARLVPDAVAAALDVRALPGRSPTETLADFLAPRTVLMVVDNCEHVLAAAATLVDALLRACPDLTILATSREPLRVPGEVVFRVPSLTIPDPDAPLAPDELLGYEAVRLFVDRAAAAAPFVLDKENAADVARICVRLDGLPLALELAAGRLGALGAGVVAERLDDRFRVLRAGSHAAPTRQQTLLATLQWSHDLLEPDEQLLFRRLTVFAGGFDLDAVEEVCAGEGLERSDVVDVLARLVEKSLVAPVDAAPQRRYRLLETVRLYARDRLVEAGEETAIADRLAQWALALAERKRELPELDQETPNLLAALDTLLARKPEDALRLCVALWTFWLRRIDLVEASRRFEAALAAAPARTVLRAEALLAVAALEARGGVLGAGNAHARESLEVAVEVGDLEAEWRALHFLGGFAITYDVGDAFAWIEQALALARREGFAAAEAIGIYALGVAQWFTGDPDGAEELVSEGIEALRRLQDRTQRIPSPMNISETRLPGVGGRPGSRIVLEESLQPFVDVSCDAALSYAIVNQAGLARVRGDFDLARALLDESARRFLEAGDERGQTDSLVRRAFLHLAEEAPEEARACLEQALAFRRNLNDRRGIGLVLSGLALIDTDTGDYENAERRLDEARSMFRRAADRWGLVIALFRTAELEIERGRIETAEAALDEARTVLGKTQIVVEAQLQRWYAHTFAALAEVAVLRDDEERAVALLGEARERYAAKRDSIGVASVDERIRLLQIRR